MANLIHVHLLLLRYIHSILTLRLLSIRWFVWTSDG